MHNSNSKASRWFAWYGRLRRDEGNSLVELGLLLGFFGAPLVLGTAQAGMLIYDSIEVSSAAHAAAMYGMQGMVYASDTTQMIAAAQSEASDLGTSLTVTPTTYWVCSNAIGGTQYTGTSAASDATAACSGGSNHPLEFVQVSTQKTITPAVHFPGLPATLTLKSNSVMEVEE